METWPKRRRKARDHALLALVLRRQSRVACLRDDRQPGAMAFDQTGDAEAGSGPDHQQRLPGHAVLAAERNQIGRLQGGQGPGHHLEIIEHMHAVEAEGRLELVAVDDPRTVGHDAAVIGHGTRDGQHGPFGLLAAGPARKDVGDGFPDGREVSDLHIVDRPDLVAASDALSLSAKRALVPPISARRICSCLADTHDLVAAAPCRLAGTVPSAPSRSAICERL